MAGKKKTGIRFGKPLIGMLFRTNRITMINEEVLLKALANGRSVILCCWHGRLLFPLHCFRKRGFHALAGLHDDADIVSQIGEKMGWHFIRGSSSSGGKEAYQKMVEVLSSPGQAIVVTPDGPQGPEHVAKVGAVKAAQRTDALLIPITGHATRRWEIANWDTFEVPKPFGRIRFAFGEPLEAGAESSTEKLNSKLENRMISLQKENDAQFTG